MVWSESDASRCHGLQLLAPDSGGLTRSGSCATREAILEAMSIFPELLRYLRAHKKLWLLPLVLIFAVIGLVVALAQGSVLAPFIYSIF